MLNIPCRSWPAETAQRDVAVSRSTLRVYLAGSIRKGDQDIRNPDAFWSARDEKAVLSRVVSAAVVTLDPARSGVRRGDYYANFGCDLHLVSSCHVMVVDARMAKGVGVGAEMMFARIGGIPTITVCPRNSNYRRDLITNVCGEDVTDWTHPFIYGLSSRIVDDFTQAGDALEEIASGRWKPDRDDSPQAAIDYYRRISGIA